MSQLSPYQKMGKPEIGCELDLSHDLCKGLASLHLMNEGGDVSIFNLVRNSSVSSFVGGVNWETGMDGPTTKYNESTGYINLNNSLSDFSFIQNTLVFSITARMSLPSLTARQGIISSTSSSLEKGFSFFWENFDTTQGQQALRILVVHGVTGKSVNMHSPNNATILDSGYHSVAIVALSSVTISFFVDGELVGPTVNNNVTPALSTGDSTRSTIIGALNLASPTLFHGGTIDNIHVYNRPLAHDEVKQLHLNPYQHIIHPTRRTYYFMPPVGKSPIIYRRPLRVWRSF
jgi:hypothetical protein